MFAQDKNLKWLSRTALATAAVAALLSGCGGSDGASGINGTNGVNGTNGTNGTNAVVTKNASTLTPEQWADAKFSATITGVTIASPPVVTFKVTDASGMAVVGLNQTSKTATATVASYPNVAFSIAKLVPGTKGSPSKWVSYNVTSVPSTTAASLPGKPTTDNTGTLVDNGDGSYKYTFYRDITKIKDTVAGMAAAAKTANANNDVADLGDLTYDPNLTHRVVLQLSGNARGTGTNVANGVQVVPGVALQNPLNVVYDFIPATGKPVSATDAQRDIVKMSACMECHSKFEFHGGARQDPRFCVTCHTDQRKYGNAEAATTATGYSGSTAKINGKSAGDLPAFLHRLHMGKELSKTGYNYANILFNEVTYPQTITNCVKCHDGSANAVNKTTQGDNWKAVPSAMACGACHDGINWATGKGTALGDAGKVVGGHVGGAQSTDASCALCHDAAAIPVYHVTVDPTGSSGRAGYPVNTATDVPTKGFPSGQGPSIPLASQLNMPAGVFKINFEIKQATIAGAAGAKKATVIYRVLKDGQPVTFNATGFLMNNVDGSPSIYVAYATPQDNVASPSDWNSSINAAVIDIRDAKSGNKQTGPDSLGFYTATLGATIPDNATMATAAIGINYQGFVQLGHAAYPKGIRLREPKFVMKTVDGQTARRAVVDGDKCNSCHGQLGISPSFHGGARNNGAGCVLCHTPNNSTGHTGAANGYGGGWSVSGKNLIHSIHASGKREQAFTYEATVENPNGFKEVTYPGVLNNCEQCHVSGSYDFSASTNSAALPNLLWTTEAKTDMSNPNKVPSIGLSPWITTLGSGQVNYTSDNLVSSPVASACFGCHDSQAALGHMQGNGGTIYARASTVSAGGRNNGFTKIESCMVCHGPGKVAAIKEVHMK